MGRPCLLCSADEGSWLVLEISSRPDGASYRLRHRDIAQGTLLPREPITDTWEICRYGHMRRVAQATDAALCDHEAAWLDFEARSGRSRFFLLNDPIHPNDHGHRFIARTLLNWLGYGDWENTTPWAKLP